MPSIFTLDISPPMRCRKASYNISDQSSKSINSSLNSFAIGMLPEPMYDLSGRLFEDILEWNLFSNKLTGAKYVYSMQTNPK